MLRRLLPHAAVLGAVLLAVVPASAQSPSEYYDQNCAPCHTIGQGADSSGPDLSGVTRRRDREWLIRFLLDPAAFRSDPAIAQMIKDAGGMEMPQTEGLTREMAAALIQEIEARAARASTAATVAADVPITPADIQRGQEWFTGRRALGAGGPACVQCHDAASLGTPGGGRLGLDLTLAHDRLGGTRGLTGWLRATPTPVMRALYRNRSIAPEEAHALAAFLAPPPGSAHTAAGRAPLLAGTALALVAIVLGVIGVLGARRFRGVRSAMVHRPVAAGGSR